MKIKIRNYSLKVILLVTLASAILLGAVYFFVLPKMNQSSKTETPSSLSEHEGIANKPKPPLTAESDSETQNTDASKKPEVPQVTRAEISNGTLRVSAILASSSTGTCELIVEQDGEEISKTSAPVVVGPSYFTCDGFRLSADKFGADGSLTIRVTHTLNGSSSSTERVPITKR